MKISVDGKFEGPGGTADWVQAWSDDYDLMPQVDACLLGGHMYPGYEKYWTAIQNEPDTPVWITGAAPTPAEREWAAFITNTPHYVLSTSLDSALWPQTTFLRSADDVASLKEGPGKDIYLLGGAGVAMSLLEAGLVDELRLIAYPLIAGQGKALFASARTRRQLELRGVEQRAGGLLSLVYGVTSG